MTAKKTMPGFTGKRSPKLGKRAPKTNIELQEAAIRKAVSGAVKKAADRIAWDVADEIVQGQLNSDKMQRELRTLAQEELRKHLPAAVKNAVTHALKYVSIHVND